eukprot:5922288-Amphidinium_carterae.2
MPSPSKLSSTLIGIAMRDWDGCSRVSANVPTDGRALSANEWHASLGFCDLAAEERPACDSK